MERNINYKNLLIDDLVHMFRKDIDPLVRTRAYEEFLNRCS